MQIYKKSESLHFLIEYFVFLTEILIQNSLKWAIYECFTSIEVMI